MNQLFFKEHPPCDSVISQIGERQLIAKLKEWLGPITPPAPAGIGDDCAVLKASHPSDWQVITTDSVTYGQHFDETARPEDAGAKLIKRNLSDIAAMGAEPGPALLNLLCGPNLSVRWLQQFISGMRESCQSYGITIVGGDVSQLAPGHFTAALTLTGWRKGSPALRSTASTGDNIYVTGTLGGSILGKHLSFDPRLQEGRWLADQNECSSMMDLTDGLGKDLAALLPEGCSAAINLKKLPISEDALKCANSDSRSPEEHAFCDGEDYELLFTVAGGTDLAAFESKWGERFPKVQVSHVGTFIQARAEGLYIDATSGTALPWQSGFEHFKSK